MTDRELERRLRAWYLAEVGEDETAPLTLRRDIAAIPRAPSRPARRFRRGRGITLLAAALLIVGGAMAAGSGLLRLPSLVPPEPVPSLALAPIPSPAEPPTSPPISPSPAPSETSSVVQLGTWTATGSMGTPRRDHSATLLPDGRVLVAGGGDLADILASAELYDPASGSWTATGSMITARLYHTATLLPDGRVLVSGGWGRGSFLASAELYDPATGSWTATESMGTTRYWNTATLLADGKVLVTGGVTNNAVVATAELYDPSTGTWAATGSMVKWARIDHTATLLRDGRVLVTGGEKREGTQAFDHVYNDVVATAELYDPATGTWTATGDPTILRSGQAATLLPDGQVLVAGGARPPEPSATGISTAPPWSGIAPAELYDPGTGSWTASVRLFPADVLTATLLPDGRVLVMGGSPGGPYPANYAGQLYDPASGSWTFNAGMIASRIGHTATLLPDGRVLVAGGDDAAADAARQYSDTAERLVLASAELYDPASP